MSKVVRAILVTVVVAAMHNAEARFGFGRTPTADEIAALDIAIGPGGAELPAGAGDVATGGRLFAERCAACHGSSGHEGPDDRLVGGAGSLGGDKPVLTIGSYWPYATTIFDYVRRAMPFPAPGSLTAAEVYALTAWLLQRNGIVGEDFVADRNTLPAVIMPNREGFISDPRPEQFNQASSTPEGE